MDFGVLPPEINSGRMYAGPGSASMVAAAAAWDGVAAESRSAAVSYSSVVSALLAEPWLGPAAAAMAVAAAPYAEWLATTAAQAEQTAAQARAAAAAFEAAFAATVPPPLIAANRSRLMSLVATNILGQNSPAIAATQAEYAEMWAQDSAAMYSYEGASSGASTLTPFTQPTQSADPAGPTAQAAAVAQAGASAATNEQTTLAQLFPGTLGDSLSAMSTPADPLTSGLLGIAESVNPQLPNAAQAIITPIGELDALALYVAAVGTASVALSVTNTARPWRYRIYANGGELQPTQAGLLGSTGDLGADLGHDGGATPVSAGAGQASLVGALSVPHSWTTAAPEIQLAVEALPSSSVGTDPSVLDGSPAGLLSGMALASLAARGMGGVGGVSGRSTGAAAPEQEERKPTVVVIQKPPPAGNRPL
jgi:PPE-repeat protein